MQRYRLKPADAELQWEQSRATSRKEMQQLKEMQNQYRKFQQSDSGGLLDAGMDRQLNEFLEKRIEEGLDDN